MKSVGEEVVYFTVLEISNFIKFVGRSMKYMDEALTKWRWHKKARIVKNKTVQMQVCPLGMTLVVFRDSTQTSALRRW